MGQEGREWIPVRVSGVMGRKEGHQSLLRREQCSDTGGDVKWEREGRALMECQSRAVEEMWLCSVVSVAERSEEG